MCVCVCVEVPCSAAAHPKTEIFPAAINKMGLPDAHGLLKGFGYNISYPAVPAWATTAFVTVNTMIDPRMCGSVNIFGLESSDDNDNANFG